MRRRRGTPAISGAIDSTSNWGSSFLVGVVGSRASRRPLLLGPVADTVLAMLPLCDELAAPLLVGPHAAGTHPDGTLHSLGQFLLPDQMHPKPLYRSAV